METLNLPDESSTLRAHLTLTGFSGGLDSKESAHNVRNLCSIPGSGDYLENGTASHSYILA